MDVIKTVWDILTNEKFWILIGSAGVPSFAITWFTYQQNKRDKEQKKREQAVQTIAAIAKWLSIPPKGYTEAERCELHNLVWQATLWLPDDLAKEFLNILSWEDEDVRRVLYDVRTYIRQGKKSRIRKLILCLKEVFFPQKKEVFEKDDIVIFPPPEKKPE